MPRRRLTCAEGSSDSAWDRRLSPPRVAALGGEASAPASLGSPIISVPGRQPDARAPESATGTRAQRRRRSAERETQTLSSSHFRRLTGKARGDAIKSREIYPKGPAKPPALAPPPRWVRSCNAPAPLTTRAATSRDIRHPGSSPSLALVFVGKQSLGLVSKSRWLGSDVLLRGSHD